MHTFGLELPGGVLARVSHFDPLTDCAKFRTLAEAYLPGVLFTEPPAKPNLDITVKWSTNTGVLVTGHESYGMHVSMFDTWRGDESALDLLNLLYAGVRRLWLHRGLYPVHSACVGGENGYALIVGHSDSGKTAITRRLAAGGTLVLSGNKTLVSFADGKVTAVAGTRTITTLAQDAGETASDDEAAVAYQQRAAFVLPAEQYATAPANIKLIVLAKLNDGYNRQSLVPSGSATHRLYPYFMDSVNADVVLCGGHEVFPGDAPSGSRERLSRALQTTLHPVPVYTLSGSLNYVTEFVAEHL